MACPDNVGCEVIVALMQLPALRACGHDITDIILFCAISHELGYRVPIYYICDVEILGTRENERAHAPLALMKYLPPKN